MQDIEAIKQGIDDLLKSDLSDIASLNRVLSADLQEEPSGNPYFVVRRSASGVFGGAATGDIELRNNKDDPRQALINIQLSEPEVEASSFVRKFWPDAEFAPARPNAADSAAYWSAVQGDAKVRIGQAPGKDVVSTITVDRIR